MTIGARQFLCRTPRHQKVSQDAFFNQRHTLRRHTLVIDLIVTDELLGTDLTLRWIVEYGDERRQHWTVHSFDKFTECRLPLRQLAFRKRQPLS